MDWLDFSALPPAWHWAFALVLAAEAGSFLTVATTRLPRRWRRGGQGPTTLGGRSYCPGCGALIPIYRNVPVLTWLIRRGQAACCDNRIPWMYLLLEIGSVLIVVGAIVSFGFTWWALLASVVWLAFFGLGVGLARDASRSM